MDYLIHLAIIFCIYAILALSLNLIVGYTGLVSVTHAAFFGIGAYVTAILESTLKWNFFPSLLVGIVVTMVFATIIGYVLSKFSGDFYVLGSVGLNIIVFTVTLNWQDLTGGPLGIHAIPKPQIFGLDFYNNALFLALSAIMLVVV